MLESILKNFDILEDEVKTNVRLAEHISFIPKEMLSQLVELLQLLRDRREELCKEGEPTLRLVLLIKRFLLLSLKVNRNDPSWVKVVKKRLSSNIES